MYDKKIMRKYKRNKFDIRQHFVAVFWQLPCGSCTTKDAAHDTRHNNSRKAASRTWQG